MQQSDTEKEKNELVDWILDAPAGGRQRVTKLKS